MCVSVYLCVCLWLCVCVCLSLCQVLFSAPFLSVKDVISISFMLLRVFFVCLLLQFYWEGAGVIERASHLVYDVGWG